MKIELKPIGQRRVGLHTCTANYGWCGEHTAFRAKYQYPCGHVKTLDQCSAWPITVTECEECGQDMVCGLDQSRTTVPLR